MTRTTPLILLSLVAGAVLSAANPCTAQTYTLTDLGPSGVYTARAINNNGQVVGQAAFGASTSSNLSDPFLLSNGTLTDLGNFGSEQSAGAYAINSVGEVVGLTGTTPAGSQTAFLFSNGALTELPVDGGTPQAINTAGTVVGYFSNPDFCSPSPCAGGFKFSDGTLTNLPIGAAAINTSGQIAGTSEGEAAVLQPDGTVTLLGFLPGENLSRSFAINDAGQVTGSAYTTVPVYAEHAFLFSNGQITDIDTLGSIVSRGYAINSNGVVVGVTAAPNQPGIDYHAMVAMDGEMMDLNTLIPAGSGLTLMQANGINDAGVIVGQAQSNSTGNVSGFLLTPVPPEITSISPVTGTAGNVVTITGKNFTKKPAACKVTFNGKVAKATSWSTTQVKVEVPTGATTGNVVLTAFFQKSNGKTFTVTK